MQTETISDKSALSSLAKSSGSEVNRLVWGNIAYIALVYIHFGLGVAGYVPLWTFCIAAPMYVSRWMIGLHDALHVVKPQDTNPIVNLHLLIVTPISLGYKEIRDIHMRHHGYTLTEKDPDLYLIRGNVFSAYLNAVFSPEISAYRWVRDNGIDRQLMFGMLLRFTLFSLFVWGLGWTSLWYFIPVRLAYGGCMFSISFPLHHKAGSYGTFTPQFGKFLETIMLVYFGRAALHTLSYHDIHHDYPRISALKLPEARRYYQPKPSSLARMMPAESFRTN
jgi:fatty acid desaturase